MRRRLDSGALTWLAAGVVALGAGAAMIGVVLALGQPSLQTENSTGMWDAIGFGLLMRTVGVAFLIGAAATLLGLPAGWAMRRVSAGSAVLLAAPLFVPTYLIYASWGLARAPGTWIGDWVERAGPGAFGAVNFAQAVGGLSLWAWPIAAVLIGRAAAKISENQLDALRSVEPRRWRRGWFVARALSGAIALSVGVIGLLMLGSAVPLHVARIGTYAIEIWRLLNETNDPARVWVAATPLLSVAMIGGVTLTYIVVRANPKNENDWRQSGQAPGGWSLAPAIAIWLCSTMLPLGLFVWSLRSMKSLRLSAISLAPAAGQSAIIAVVVGTVGMLIALGARVGFSRGARRTHSLGAKGSMAILFITALTPGVLIGASLLSASRLAPFTWLVETALGVATAHMLRFGVIAALAGWWLARLEPRDLADLRRLESVGSIGVWWRTVGSAKIGAIVGVGLVMSLLSAHEIEATIMLAPPGYRSLAQTLLNQLHYLRMEELSAAGVWLLAGGAAILLLVAAGVTATQRAHRCSFRAIALVGVMSAAAMGAGCDAGAGVDPGPIRVVRVLGEVGSAPGQVAYPRCLDADETSLWIIDKTARVQRWSFAGEPMIEWAMPATERGMPTGITVGPDGLIYVADTHEHRVSVFTKAGELVTTWGAYGTEPGEFIYPTDVAFLLDEQGEIERVYVSEYGGNDRISVFDPQHEFLFSFGKEGSSDTADEIEFARPQSMVFDQSRRELIVTDSSNHRVGRFLPDGELIAWIGGDGGLPGGLPGEFRYPYGVAMLPDGSILVSEFGGNRVQLIEVTSGASLGVYGRAGVGEGELRSPWGVASAGRLAFVLDSGSNRIIAFAPDRQPSRPRASEGGVDQ